MSFICQKCGEEFATRSELATHQNEERREAKRMPEPREGTRFVVPAEFIDKKFQVLSRHHPVSFHGHGYINGRGDLEAIDFRVGRPK